MTKSKKKPAVIFLSVLMCSLFSLAGCKDAEREDAIAEAASAKKELAKVKADLAKTMNERDSLKLELTAVTDARDKLQAAVDQAENIKEQLAGFTKERDTAIAKVTETQNIVENLKSQLAEQIQKVVGLESQNKKLQEMIDELKNKLGSEVEIPSIPGL